MCVTVTTRRPANSRTFNVQINEVEACVAVFIKLMDINLWLLFFGNQLFVLIVEILSGKSNPFRMNYTNISLSIYLVPCSYLTGDLANKDTNAKVKYRYYDFFFRPV